MANEGLRLYPRLIRAHVWLRLFVVLIRLAPGRWTVVRSRQVIKSPEIDQWYLRVGRFRATKRDIVRAFDRTHIAKKG